MSMAVGNSNSSIGDIKNNTQASGKPDKQVPKNTFAEIQTAQLASGTTAYSAIGAGSSPNAVTSTSARTENLTESQAADQLLVQGRLAIQQDTDPKKAADGSKPEGQLAVASNTPQAISTFPTGTFKSLFGELPSNIDRSGLSGIIDGQGHNLTNQEITSYFDQNPSTTQMEKDKIAMGLSDAQMANAIAIAMGQSYTAPVLDSSTSSTTVSRDGSVKTMNNLYSSIGAASLVQSAAATDLTTAEDINYFA